jgi:hypothetical protein
MTRKAASGVPSRMIRSRAYLGGPLRSIERGVTSPKIRKNNPIANSTPAMAGTLSILLW